MITEQQYKMKTYNRLFDVKGQLMTIFNELYDINIETELDTQPAKNEVIRALNCVRDLMEGDLIEGWE